MAQYHVNIAKDMGNASDWTYNALTKGYQVTNTPQPHNAVVFEPNQFGADRYYGHVAFVEKVNDDGSIVISETNVKGLGVISYRTLDAKQPSNLILSQVKPSHKETTCTQLKQPILKKKDRLFYLFLGFHHIFNVLIQFSF